MNGATGVPEKKMRMANKAMTKSIGTSHHFLFSLRKAQNSTINVGRSAMSLSLLEQSLIISTTRYFTMIAPVTASSRVSFKTQYISSHAPKENGDRRDHSKKEED